MFEVSWRRLQEIHDREKIQDHLRMELCGQSMGFYVVKTLTVHAFGIVTAMEHPIFMFVLLTH